MNGTSTADEVYVEAAARLHFGVLDLSGTLGRWFGGIGAAAPTPTLLVSASPADSLEVSGEDAERADEFARRVVSHFGFQGGACVRVHRALPAHAGLGSGTQLALAIGRALSELHGLGVEAGELARIVGRGHRSAIGTWTFSGGGLVVEGGRRRTGDEVAPLIARVPMPSSWRCIVAVPDGAAGVSGADEADAFVRLPRPPEHEAEQVAHLVLMSLLPAVADADLPAFGAALTAIQSITGCWFAPVQGGTYAPGPTEEIVRRMAEWGAMGVGQSSWGPTAYGVVEGADAGSRLADHVRALLDGAGTVYEGPFRAEGARVWRAPVRVRVSAPVDRPAPRNRATS